MYRLGLAALAPDAARRGRSRKQPAAAATKTTSAEPARAEAQGWIVVVDPVTKQIRRPEAAEIQALTGGMKKPAALVRQPLQTFQGPGRYGVGLKLDNNSMVFAVATKTPEGGLVSDCITGEKAALAKVTGAQPVADKKVLDVR